MEWRQRYSFEEEEYLAERNAPALADKPDSIEDLAWTAFSALKGTRAEAIIETDKGFKRIPQPLTMSQIESYCNYFGISDMIKRRWILHVVLTLDRMDRENANTSS